MIRVEALSDERQELELQNARMRGELEVMEHLKKGCKEDKKKKLESIQEEHDEYLEDLKSLNQKLITSERINNDELQEARKLLFIVSFFELIADFFFFLLQMLLFVLI